MDDMALKPATYVLQCLKWKRLKFLNKVIVINVYGYMVVRGVWRSFFNLNKTLSILSAVIIC